MSVDKTLEKLLKRYPEDKDVQKLNEEIKTLRDEDIDSLLLRKMQRMVDEAIMNHEYRRNHYPYYYTTWSNSPTWSSSVSEGISSNGETTTGKLLVSF